MRIGIIGVGHIGGILARRLAKLGHAVSVASSRGPEPLATLAEEIGVAAVSVAEAPHGADVVIMAIPEKSIPLLPRDLFHRTPDATIVVDTGNYYPALRDGTIEAIEQGSTESGWVARQLGRRVVKAFNNITARSLAEGGRPRGTPGRIALPVAGDDIRAKKVVIGLADELGFDGFDGGTLDDSWRQQPGTPVYCSDLDVEGARRALAEADRTKPKRDEKTPIRAIELQERSAAASSRDPGRTERGRERPNRDREPARHGSETVNRDS